MKWTETGLLCDQKKSKNNTFNHGIYEKPSDVLTDLLRFVEFAKILFDNFHKLIGVPIKEKKTKGLKSRKSFGFIGAIRPADLRSLCSVSQGLIERL